MVNGSVGHGSFPPLRTYINSRSKLQQTRQFCERNPLRLRVVSLSSTVEDVDAIWMPSIVPIASLKNGYAVESSAVREGVGLSE